MSKRILIIEEREWLLRLVEQAIREEQPDDEVLLAGNLITGLVEMALGRYDLVRLGGTSEAVSEATLDRLSRSLSALSPPPILLLRRYLSSEDERPIFVEIDQLQAAVSTALAGELVAVGRKEHEWIF